MISSADGGVELETRPDHVEGAESDVCGCKEEPSSGEADESTIISGVTGLGVDDSGIGEICCDSVLE